MLLKNIKTRLQSFYQDTSGVVTVEFALAMPILFWAYMASYVFFDGYRQSAINTKAAYTISDLLSRETTGVNDEYIDSMLELVNLMTRTPSDVNLRISVVRWSGNDERYYLDWSANRGFPTDLTDANISDLESRLPIMPNGERVILVETRNVFVPLFRVGMKPINLDNFIFSRPRFVSNIAWEQPPDSEGTGVEDEPTS